LHYNGLKIANKNASRLCDHKSEIVT